MDGVSMFHEFGIILIVNCQFSTCFFTPWWLLLAVKCVKTVIIESMCGECW